MESGMRKVSAHCATDDFRIPQVNRAREGDGYRGTERGRGTDQCSDVPWILDCVEHEDASGLRGRDVVERAYGDGGDREDPLRRIGLGCAVELGWSNFLHVEPAAGERVTQRDAARVPVQPWRREDANDAKRRRSELLDRAGALNSEQSTVLSRFSAPEVPR
jgi:hypothetical protein